MQKNEEISVWISENTMLKRAARTKKHLKNHISQNTLVRYVLLNV